MAIRTDYFGATNCSDYSGLAELTACAGCGAPNGVLTPAMVRRQRCVKCGESLAEMEAEFGRPDDDE